MATDLNEQQANRSLLGLTSPTVIPGAAVGDRTQPARPDYPVISSGRDSEDGEERSSKGDSWAALWSGTLFMLAILGVAYLLS